MTPPPGPMSPEEFRAHAHGLVDWMADYMASVERYPVKSPSAPGEILAALPLHAPETGEQFGDIFADFTRTILPGMTHWQHPSFFAYFPANSSPPSVLAEMLTATLGAQCMSWVTSPAATELEERVMEWLREMIALPPSFTGVIQDTASTATLCAVLSARERSSNFAVNEGGFPPGRRFTAYASTETHSSVERAVRIAGLGAAALRKLPVDRNYAMQPEALREAIARDRREGCTPLVAVATLGTTGSTAIDPLKAIGDVCRGSGVWLHVDAAYAGTALLAPEMRWMSEGIEAADSFVFNPHKWMFTNFDCSAYFVRDADALVRTFAILPEYLKTGGAGDVKNYRDWGIQLGRRFRALKLWFVIRHYGVEGLRHHIRRHVALAQEFAGWVAASADFELVVPAPLNLVCFAHRAGDDFNRRLLERLNQSGKLYLTHTVLNGRYTLRLCVGQTHTEAEQVRQAWALIQQTAKQFAA
ncbi:MAG TPA: aminotransferase class V-fold PLP-dependent enzyme [Bacteroidota bacterium]|nr:aminotransferase class V-fold PLP-dependent enzyme [Bacteroidota bacterium]